MLSRLALYHLSFLVNLLFLKVSLSLPVVGFVFWSCHNLLKTWDIPRTLIPVLLSFVSDTLPPLPLSCTSWTFYCSSIILSFESGVIVSVPLYYLCKYLSTVFRLGTGWFHTFLFPNHSLESHPACFDSLEVSCYVFWYHNLPGIVL